MRIFCTGRLFTCKKWNVLAFSLVCNRKSTTFLSYLKKYIKKRDDKFQLFSSSII